MSRQLEGKVALVTGAALISGHERSISLAMQAVRIRKSVGLCAAAVALLLATAAAAQTPPLIAFPVYGGAATERFLQLNLGNGDCHSTDRVRDPLQLVVRLQRKNLYRQIGRPTDQVGHAGEVLLGPILGGDGSTKAAFFAETSTGYVAFFEDIGRGGDLGTISVALDRPFKPLASMDGNYALMMRRDSTGRTDGAYLYHATSGRMLYYGGVRKLATDSRVAVIRDMPQLSGRVAAAAIQSSREETLAFLVLDGGNGDIHLFDIDRGNPTRVGVRKSSRTLAEVFPEPGPQPTPQRFVAAPVLASNDRTLQVFVLDASSGEMALIDNVESQPIPRQTSANFYQALGEEQPGSALRLVSPIPNLSNTGQTIGIWLLDSLSGKIGYVDGLESPAQTRVRLVVVNR